MSRRPPTNALALALALPLAAAFGAADAADLMQTYELARANDPQLSAAESNRLATREGAVQARAALLPQLDGTATLSRSRSTSSGSGSTQINPITGQPVVTPGIEREIESTSRNYGLNVQQMVYDRGNFTRLRSQRALSQAADFQLES
ncbi:MAG TPA: TolC family protein, partial [Pseudoxanthomonas sp.]|nr:TolC family protein [Pseudoxanthomonas sp.]